MTMIKLFAIEPEALTSWNDFRYVMEKMGFSQGRVVVTYPKKWAKRLLDNLDQVTELERQRFVVKLQRYKQDRIVTLGLPYDPSVGWIDNVKRHNAICSKKTILISRKTKDALGVVEFLSPDDVDEEFFSCAREIRCLNTAEALAKPAELLLSMSHQATFVDPYFNPLAKRNLAVLKAFVTVAAAGNKCREFWIYVHCDRMKPDGERLFQQTMDQALTPLLADQRFKLSVAWIKDMKDGGFHARYLLTAHAGLRYDKGFATQHAPEPIDISILDDEIFRQLSDIYGTDVSRSMDVSETWSWEYNP